MIWKKIFSLTLTAVVIATPFAGLSCGSYKKKYKKFGDEEFLYKNKNLSYLDEAEKEYSFAKISNYKKTNTTYQMLVYSFADGNDDGIGDFIGAKNKLDYLKNIGIDSIWLSPIHPSSSYHGYDVIDYTEVSKELGGTKAFESFLDVAHSKGIKIYLDMVFNHTSYEHPWFQEALKGNSKYNDYYYFDKKAMKSRLNDHLSKDTNIRKDFLNIDKSVLDTNKKYTAHFWSGMPDLNLNNEKVIKEFNNIIKFWNKKGIDGYRFDAVDEMFNPLDEPETKFSVNKIFGGIRKLTDGLDISLDRAEKTFLFAESWHSLDETKDKLYYSDSNDQIKPTFNSYYDSKTFGDKILLSNLNINALKGHINSYRSKNSDAIWMPSLDNHDRPRWFDNYYLNFEKKYNTNWYKKSKDKIYERNKEVVGNFAAFSSLMPANLIIYQGTELSYRGKDKSTRPDTWNREPIKWNDLKSRVNFKQKRNEVDHIKIYNSKNIPNVNEQISDKNSIYNIYKNVLRIRKDNPWMSSNNGDSLDVISDNSIYKGKGFVRKNNDNSKKIIFLQSRNKLEIRNSNLKNIDINKIKILYRKNAKIENSKIQMSDFSILIGEI